MRTAWWRRHRTTRSLARSGVTSPSSAHRPSGATIPGIDSRRPSDTEPQAHGPGRGSHHPHEARPMPRRPIEPQRGLRVPRACGHSSVPLLRRRRSCTSIQPRSTDEARPRRARHRPIAEARLGEFVARMIPVSRRSRDLQHRLLDREMPRIGDRAMFIPRPSLTLSCDASNTMANRRGSGTLMPTTCAQRAAQGASARQSRS